MLQIVQPKSEVVPIEQVEERAASLQGYGQSIAERLIRIFHLDIPCIQQADPNWRDRPDWLDSVCALLDEPVGSGRYGFQSRTECNWTYFNFWTKGVSGAQLSTEAGASLRETMNSFVPSMELDAVQRHVITTKHMRHAYDLSARAHAQSLLSLLDNNDQQSAVAPLLIPIESHLIGVGTRSIVILRTNCGVAAFEDERILSEKKRNSESEIFSTDAQLVWSDQLDEEQFEDLILELLQSDEGVVWAKKVGGTYDRDGGRDIIVEWDLPPDRTGRTRPGRDDQLRERLRILVQVKVRAKSVGKSDVTDIRDTLEQYNCDGLLVVAFPRVTTPLFDHLSTLRENGRFWVDWWERPDVELRLRKQTSIAGRYANLMRFVRLGHIPE